METIGSWRQHSIRATQAEWERLNPVVDKGEFAIMTTSTGEYVKQGDGIVKWKDLKWLGASPDSNGGEASTKLPPGGMTEQALVKLSDKDNDYGWATLPRANAIQLLGMLLSRQLVGVISYTTVPKSLFPVGTVFYEGRTFIYDINGTVGIYRGDKDASNINVQTITTSVQGANIPMLIGIVNTFADIPASVAEIQSRFNHTPIVADRLRVRQDETQGGAVTDYYVNKIDGDTIEWSDPPVVFGNDDPYQEQGTAGDAGLVPTFGAEAGTWGDSRPISSKPTADPTDRSLITAFGAGQIGLYSSVPQVAGQFFDGSSNRDYKTLMIEGLTASTVNTWVTLGAIPEPISEVLQIWAVAKSTNRFTPNNHNLYLDVNTENGEVYVLTGLDSSLYDVPIKVFIKYVPA